MPRPLALHLWSPIPVGDPFQSHRLQHTPGSAASGAARPQPQPPQHLPRLPRQRHLRQLIHPDPRAPDGLRSALLHANYAHLVVGHSDRMAQP
jgi:hypothetical protein